MQQAQYYFKKLLFIFLSVISFASCRQHKQLTHSFYFWQLDAEADTSFATEIKRLDVTHFYWHIMDVAWDASTKSAYPKSISHTDIGRTVQRDSITPVVFITNDVFLHSGLAQCDSLAGNILKKINAITSQKNFAFSELQIDCDWTANSQSKYFRFLASLKKSLGSKLLSVTVRLYPYKYQTKMGIPPVDKGVLMCYNLGSIENTATNNSIFDEKELKKYLTVENYPLPLDVALPVFGWYVWFRNNEYKNIVYGPPELINDNHFKKNTENNYQVVADTVVQNFYIRQGDILRREFPDSEALVNSAKFLMEKRERPNRIIFYHWDRNSIKYYEKVIEKIYDLP